VALENSEGGRNYKIKEGRKIPILALISFAVSSAPQLFSDGREDLCSLKGGETRTVLQKGR
jgi:hypothetical protein